MKYLTKRNNCYWYRRKIPGYGELHYSLKTQIYDIAILRHSYLNYKINQLVRYGAFKKMSRPDVKTMIYDYVKYMIDEEYNDYAEQRDKELGTYIDGKFFGGHTAEALELTLDKYMDVVNSGDINLVKGITNTIIKRSNLQATYDQLETENERDNFHWRLIKAECEILEAAYLTQVERFGANKARKLSTQQPAQPQPSTNKMYPITILELLECFIAEQRGKKEERWEQGNEDNIRYVLNHLADWFHNKPADELKRKDFSDFRDEVLKKLPAHTKRKTLQNVSTRRMLEITKKEKIKTLASSTINKHLRRIHEVFAWGKEADLISKNLTKSLALDNDETRANKRAKILPYLPTELKKLFEESPWFTTELRQQLKQNPQNIFIPLLSLWMGARPTELAMLATSSICQTLR